jgi:hypothetical protein
MNLSHHMGIFQVNLYHRYLYSIVIFGKNVIWFYYLKELIFERI